MAEDSPNEQPSMEQVERDRQEVLDAAAAASAAGSGESAGGDFLLEARGIIAGYVPGVNILNGCALELTEGEIVGIIGPNGAGKSTLIKALFGLLKVTEGSITLRGEEISGLNAHELVARGIGYVPQRENVFPRLTIAENLEMGVYQRPKEFAAQKERVIGMFPRLGERLDQRAGLLSGGERQMLALARALTMEPSVILLDEPSAGLSPALQDEVFERTKQINEDGVSVIMVEQNARRCLQICDRGYVLDQGQNAYTDSGPALLTDPKVIELYLGTLAQVD
jgi:branched-chain amino acid transport system ATP-binding protein